MLSTIRCKELIGKSIDFNEPLPQWLEDQIAKDTHLAEFYEASLALSDELRDSAVHWVRTRDLAQGVRSATVLPELVQRKSSPRPHQRLFMLSSAAVLLLAIGGVLHFALKRNSNWNGMDNLPRASSPEVSSVPPTNDALLAQADAAESSLQISDVELTDFQQAKEEQFKKYFYVTVECSVRTLQSVGGTLSERAVCYPLQNAIKAHETSSKHSNPAGMQDVQSSASSIPKELQERQMKLINELMQTTDFLVETLPEEVTRSWVELSIASNDSL